MKKKVVYLCQRWTTGGIESIITKILHYINKDNYEFEILVSQKETDIFDNELNSLNINIVQLNKKIKKNPIIRNIETFYKIVKYFKKEKKDIIHINIYNSMSCIYALIADFCGIHKIILHSHNSGFDNDYFKIKLLLNNVCKKIFYNKKYTYIACSNDAAKFCFNKKALEKCQIINNGIYIDDFLFNEDIRKKYRKKLNIDNSFVVGNVGRLVEQKNQLRLINIFSNIKKISKNSKLIIVGEGSLEKDLIKEINEKRIQNDVIILKKRKDVNNILQAMDCFVFPSLYEGYGIVAIEAQASGLPTFIADNLSEQIFATENSYGISLKNSDIDIAKFILKKSQKLKRKSPVMNKYDIRNMVNRILECYET